MPGVELTDRTKRLAAKLGTKKLLGKGQARKAADAVTKRENRNQTALEMAKSGIGVGRKKRK